VEGRDSCESSCDRVGNFLVFSSFSGEGDSLRFFVAEGNPEVKGEEVSGTVGIGDGLARAAGGVLVTRSEGNDGGRKVCQISQLRDMPDI